MSEQVEAAPQTETPARRIALVGNPNVGKTSVFNRLTNLRAKTSNFSGTTVEKRVGQLRTAQNELIEVVDLPGLFSLDAQSPDERISKGFLEGTSEAKPDAVLVVVDATNLQRSLFVAGEAVQLGLPTLLVVNMIESARSKGINIDVAKLSQRLDCTVVAVSARTGEGFDQLRTAMDELFVTKSLPIIAEELCTSCNTCPVRTGTSVGRFRRSGCQQRGRIPFFGSNGPRRSLVHAPRAWVGDLCSHDAVPLFAGVLAGQLPDGLAGRSVRSARDECGWVSA